MSLTRARSFGLAVALLCALALAACTGQAEQQDSEPQVLTATETTETGEETAPTPAGAANPTAPAGRGTPATTATPGGVSSLEVAPKEVTVGGVTLTMALEPARHMFDQEAATKPNPDQAQTKSEGQTTGSAVFTGGMLDVTNNFDPSQSPPADSPQGILRHVAVQAKTKDGQPVPYLAMTMDVLLDGRPALIDQALVPMVAVDREGKQVYYGNNVKFPGPGTYQIFIRLQKNPVLGQDQPPAAQFNLTIR